MNITLCGYNIAYSNGVEGYCLLCEGDMQTYSIYNRFRNYGNNNEN